LSVWFIIWLILSGALMYFSVWTFYILHRQKKSWKDFAKKHKLRYRAESLMAAPDINGVMDGYTLGVFTSEHMTADMRGTRKMTAVEVELSSAMPFDGAVASGKMTDLVQGLNYSEELRPAHKNWDVSYIARSRNGAALEAYLTQERLDAVTSLMKVRNFWVIFIFQGENTLLRVDTFDPCDNPDKIEKIVRRLIRIARILELKEGEGARLQSQKRKPPQKGLTDPDAGFDEEEITLELEDDEAQQAEEEAEEEKKNEAEQQAGEKPRKPEKKKG